MYRAMINGRLLRVEYQPFVGITDNQYTDLPEAARNKLDEQALALALAGSEGLNSCRKTAISNTLHRAVLAPATTARCPRSASTCRLRTPRGLIVKLQQQCVQLERQAGQAGGVWALLAQLLFEVLREFAEVFSANSGCH